MKAIGLFVLSAIAYFAAGKVGGVLSIPPGFASAVWPASGVALALALRFGLWPAALGAWLGNLATSLALSSDNFSHITFPGAMSSGSVGFAACLQVVIGFWLFRRLLGEQLELTVARAITSFVFVVAMVGCFVSCTVSSFALWFWGLIPASIIGFTWVTWWVGDSLGVLFFTPFLLTVMTSNRLVTIIQKLQILLPTTAIFLCTWIMFSTSQEWQKKSTLLQIENESLDIYHFISEHMQTSGDVLAAYDALVNSLDSFDQNRFETFSAVMLKNNLALYGVGWTEIVPHSERAAIEQHYRDNGYPDFSFTQLTPEGALIQALPQDEYYPVLNISPLANNHRAFGLNLGADKDRFAALRQARELARPIATAPIVLAQELDNQKAIIVYRPVFGINDNVFKGYVSGVMRVDGIIGQGLNLLRDIGFSLVLTDVTNPQNPQGLVRQEGLRLAGVESFNYFTSFGGRDYQLELYPNTNHSLPSKNWVSWAVLTSGFFIAALTQMFILSVIGNHGRIREEVDRKTLDLKTQTLRANEASRAKSDFLSNMSHELRTPLNAIIGLINLCRKTNLTSQQSDYLYKATLASTTLLSLINQTLDHAKIEAGRMELSVEPFSLTYMLQKLHAVFDQSGEGKDITFNIVSRGSCPDLVVGDELRIEQILINLLGNAFKFTEAGTITLSVAYQAEVGYQFEVADTGCGIPQTYQKDLFTAFTQVDSSTSRIFGGTGLGLSISANLASMMNGTLELVNSSEQGSCFRVTVPLQVRVSEPSIQLITALQPHAALAVGDVEPETAMTNDKATLQQTLKDQPLRGVVVLLVEDIALNQMVAEGILKSFGAEVIVAANGEEALAALAGKPGVDLILMDVQMPIMDGYEATRRIRQQPQFKSLPILAMTANAMEQDILLCLEAGMDDHISKPIEANTLCEKILKKTDQAA
ncbi:CHASE domain-containing protein [Halioxenophilus aromaticivorans]|uniref:histidine kinase n=1 Tax=Halioxenophilus aromaticivorans TaxID=1306992 RepID=A0AAV3U9D6_9ALTE